MAFRSNCLTRMPSSFLGKHLPRCDCPKPVVRVRGDLRAACNHLLHMLREVGVIPRPPAPTDSVSGELHRYDKYMCDVRGLATSTRRGRLRIVERLLRQKVADNPVAIAELQPDDVRQCIASQLQLRGTVSNAAIAPVVLHGPDALPLNLGMARTA